MFTDCTRYQKFRAVIWLLVLSVFLRSLVASGYMFTATSSSRIGPDITICHGLNGINTLHGIQHFDHRGVDYPSQHSAEHSTSACGLLSASSTFISINNLEFLPFQNGLHVSTYPDSQLVYQSFQKIRFPRAPPVII